MSKILTLDDVEKALAEDEEYQELKSMSSKVTTYTEQVDKVTLNLTPKQRAFLEQYSITADVAKAIKQAGLGTHSATIQRYRSLLKTPEARLYMEKIKSLGLVKTVLTHDEIIEKARKIFDLGCENLDLKASMEAVKFLGGYKGMTPEARRVSGPNDPAASNTHMTGDKPMEVKQDISRFKELLEKASSSKPV